MLKRHWSVAHGLKITSNLFWCIEATFLQVWINKFDRWENSHGFEFSQIDLVCLLGELFIHISSIPFKQQFHTIPNEKKCTNTHTHNNTKKNGGKKRTASDFDSLFHCHSCVPIQLTLCHLFYGCSKATNLVSTNDGSIYLMCFFLLLVFYSLGRSSE